MFSPTDMVSVAKSTLIKPSWNKISITSFKIGSSPEWCTPKPRRKRFGKFAT